MGAPRQIPVPCEGVAPGQEGWCYKELPPMAPTITEDTKQQCKSKPQCQWGEVTQSICVDNNSHRLSDEACSSIGPKESCNRPPIPPLPPGPPKRPPTPTPPAPKPAPKIEVECSTKQAYVCVKGRLSEKSRREKDEWDKEFSQ